jgi:histidyl-tRNA synthetase
LNCLLLFVLCRPHVESKTQTDLSLRCDILIPYILYLMAHKASPLPSDVWRLNRRFRHDDNEYAA